MGACQLVTDRRSSASRAPGGAQAPTGYSIAARALDCHGAERPSAPARTP